MNVSRTIKCISARHFVFVRCFCSSQKVLNTNQSQQNDPSAASKRNWIGPPDKLSNIRQVKYYIPDNESEVERTYRLMQEDNDRFNHEFWAKHNASFIKAKEEFIEKKEQTQGSLLIHGDGTKHVLTAEEMSEFYRKFVNDNQIKLKEYNKEWYRRNIGTLWPAFKANMYKVFKRR
ncbi:COA8 family protein Y39B6A.34, mitochondrial-like [Ptychodera flava]|uniref:COA8 family protein Y39B6A.34, mitochondrial-like n=1 Tax=Ptychodera flava TaxID=63121 RepID=UPI003969D74D